MIKQSTQQQARVRLEGVPLPNINHLNVRVTPPGDEAEIQRLHREGARSPVVNAADPALDLPDASHPAPQKHEEKGLTDVYNDEGGIHDRKEAGYEGKSGRSRIHVG